MQKKNVEWVLKVSSSFLGLHFSKHTDIPLFLIALELSEGSVLILGVVFERRSTTIFQHPIWNHSIPDILGTA